VKKLSFIFLAVFIFSIFPLECFSEDAFSDTDRYLAKRKRRKKKKRGYGGHGTSGPAYFSGVKFFQHDVTFSLGYSNLSSNLKTSTDTTTTEADGDKKGITSFSVLYHYNYTPNLAPGGSLTYSNTSTESTSGLTTTKTTESEWILGLEFLYNFYNIDKEKIVPYAALRIGMGSKSDKTDDQEAVKSSLSVLPRLRGGVKVKIVKNAYVDAGLYYEIKSEKYEVTVGTVVTKYTYSYKTMGLEAGLGMFF